MYLEHDCEETFSLLGEVYHVCSPENHPIICNCVSDYQACVSLIGLSKTFYPKIKIIAFQVMSNHFHFIIAGNRKVIDDFLQLLTQMLSHLNKNVTFSSKVNSLPFSFFLIDSLKYLRSAIAYVHRNSFLIDSSTTPFTYSWGTNQFYFNPIYQEYCRLLWKEPSERWKRGISHSKLFDNCSNLFVLGGYISPLSFCDIELGQRLFQNARSYFQSLCRGVEMFAEISKMIGESISMTDEELFKVVLSIIKRDYGVLSITDLSIEEKCIIAKKMKYDYNASVKQIHRILNININVLDAMFGK